MILNELQKKFLNEFFSSFLQETFFLSAGTALAQYYLHHRLSEDLDLFTVNQEITFDSVNAELNKMARNLNFNIKHQVSSPSFLQYVFQHKSKPIKIDVVKDVPIHFGKIKKIGNIRVDSLENIAVGKLLAVFGRADAKDFIDLYFLFKKEKISYQKVFTMAKKKDLGLNEFYLAEMLSKVAEIKNFPPTLKPFNKKELVSFFLHLSDKLFKKIKPK